MMSLSALILGAMLPANLGSQSLALGQEHFISTARYRNHILCLQEGGRVRVRSLGDGSRDRELSAALSREGLIHIASDGADLWAASGSGLYRWLPAEESWEVVASIAGQGESPSALAICASRPLLIYSSKILMPTERRIFLAPKKVGGRPMRILALYPGEKKLWIGTGYGEWGGSLIGFNPRTEAWIVYHDPGHSVTGITQGHSGKLTVSWSMNHFYVADTLIREHQSDGRPTASFSHYRQRYYQRATYSHPDRTLYGFERDELVSIRPGRRTRLAVLANLGFAPEPMAIGVAPGVLELFPVAPGRLYIATMFNGLWMLKDGKLIPIWMP